MMCTLVPLTVYTVVGKGEGEGVVPFLVCSRCCDGCKCRKLQQSTSIVINQAAAERSWEYVYKMGYVLSRMGVHAYVHLHVCCHVTFRGWVRQSYRLLVDDILFLFVLGLSLA